MIGVPSPSETFPVSPSRRAGVAALVPLSILMLGLGCTPKATVRPDKSGPALRTTDDSASRSEFKRRLGPPEGGVQAAAELARRTAAGTWDWVFRSTTQQGDLRIEQEEWHLQQEGPRIFGYYHRQVVTLSSDQRPFRCNGMLAFVNNTRVRVVGELREGGLELREIGADVDKNPCDDGSRNLTSYVGKLEGDSLVLVFAAGGGQHLVRRPPGSPILPLAPGGGPKAAGDEDLSAVAIEGVWDWQFRAVDPEGDLHLEHEEWHLVEKSAEITGYYERKLQRKRSVGVFACNNNAVINSTTRYVVKGQRFGNKLTLTEVDYQTQPGPCENRARRLDTYQGTLIPDGQLLLSWGGGQQTLRKRR
jgi:hypothetical protein